MKRGRLPLLRRGGAGGFTLVEIIIAVAVAGVALALLYKIFGSFYRNWVAEGLKSDMRQNARVALDTVTKDFEMTGYHTTQYGDPKKANLAVTIARTTLAEEIAGDGVGDDDGVCEAGENCTTMESEIEIDQHWLDIATGTYQPRMVYYHLDTDASGRRNLYRQVRAQPGAAAADEIIAENVERFAVRYYDTDGAEIVPPLPGGYVYTPGSDPPQQLKEIRRICVDVGTRPNRVHSWMQMRAPSGAVVDPSFELSDCVSPRNLTVEEIAVDTTPPCVPANLAVVDTRSCSDKLCVRWGKCSDPDLDGYTLYYGAAGSLRLPLGLLSDPDNPQIYLARDDVLITKNANRATAPNTYVVSVSSFDSSGNRSGRSSPVSGNPDPDESDCAAGTGDTTVNPAPPSAPLSFSVRAHASTEKILEMGWSPPADGSATAGYRLYRGEDPFVSGANIDPNTAGIVRLADETTLNPGTLSYTDADPSLEACKTYSYAVASVNCDETLVPTYLYNSVGGGDYGAGTAEPQDWTPPPPASLEGTTAGWQRIFISLLNPSVDDAPDFDRTEIYFNRGSVCPQITAGTVAGGALIPDSDSGTAGTFTNRGSQTIVFDSETSANPTEPELPNMGEYCLLAVTYDGCGNTAVDSTSLVLIDLCGDDPPGPPPDWPENPTYRSCDPKWISLTWEYPPKYWTGPSQIFDFAGYRIWRHTRESGGTTELTTGPTWSESWQDAKDLQEGEGYRYEVRATDCVYENRNAEFPNNYSAPLYIPSDSGWISPGRLDIFPGDSGNPLLAQNFVTSYSDSGEPFTFHNNVRFFIQNTSRSNMDIERMRILWENQNAALENITVGGPPSSILPAQSRPTGGVPSGASVSVNVTITDNAGGINNPSVPIPIELRFTNTDGSVNHLTDMRGERLLVELQFRNQSQQASACDPETFIVVVPLGPNLSDFVQDAKRILPAPGDSVCPNYLPSLEVPGPPPGAGTAQEDDLEAPAVTDVNVLGNVLDTSGPLFDFVEGIGLGVPRGFSTLSLYYADASLAAGVPTGTFAEIPLRNLGGDSWGIYDEATSAGAKIPDVSDRAVWYYILAVDRSGNFTRYPDPSVGAFAYYQRAYDVCAQDLKPQSPVLAGTKSGGTVSLAWSAPESYADCGVIPVTDTLSYNLYAMDTSAAVDLLCGDDPAFPPTLACPATDPPSFQHTPADLGSESYRYTVKALNSCGDGDGPRESDYSNVVEEDLL